MKQDILQEMESLLGTVSPDIKQQLAKIYDPKNHSEHSAIIVIRTLFYHHFPYLQALVEDQNNLQELMALFKNCQFLQSLYAHFTGGKQLDSKLLALVINGNIHKIENENLSSQDKKAFKTIVHAYEAGKIRESMMNLSTNQGSSNFIDQGNSTFIDGEFEFMEGGLYL